MTESAAPPIRTVLFDLDGTLADTAPDLAHALNTLLEEEGHSPLSFDTIRPEVSHGGVALIKLGFGVDTDDPDFGRLRQRLLDLYANKLGHKTQLFDGMVELLDQLRARGLNWGVVTNKPGYLTDPLMQYLNLAHKATCIVSGDSTNNCKPHPEPMYHACQLAGSAPNQCLYVGDAKRDITAGQAAGMKTLVALYGYIGDDETPDSWGADGTIDQPLDILYWLNRQQTGQK